MKLVRLNQSIEYKLWQIRTTLRDALFENASIAAMEGAYARRLLRQVNAEMEYREMHFPGWRTNNE